MTEAQLLRLVKRWQKELAPLGIGHWEVSVQITNEITGKENAQAGVHYASSYDRCLMQFLPETADNYTRIDHTIVHEWLHIAFRDLAQSILSVDDALSQGVRLQWEDWVDHEEEGLIDRLATLIVALHA